MTVQRWDSPDKVEAQKLRFRPGDVVFGRRRAYQKKVALAEFDGICSAHALVLRGRPEHVHPNFLPVFLSSNYFLDRAISISVGSLSPTVNWRDLRVQEFDLPPLAEQQRIADLLWALERERREQVQLRAALEKTQAALIPVIASRADTMPTPLGEVLAVILDRRGVTPKKLGEDWVDMGIPVLSAMNIVDGEIDQGRQERYVSEDVARRWMKGWLKAGDILMTSEAPLGSTVLLVDDMEACIGQRLFALRPDSRRVLPEYLHAWLSSDVGQATLRERASGTTVKGIRQAELVKVNVPIPAFGNQQEFVSIWSQIRKTLISVSLHATENTRLRAALLAEIFGGH